MVHQATRAIAERLESKNFKYEIVEAGEASILSCGISGKNIIYRVQFISRDENNDVAVRVFDLAKFPEEKMADMIRFANEVNAKYRFIKLVADERDHTLQIETDLPIQNTDPAELAFEMLARILKIVDEISQDMMRRILF